MIKYNLLLVKKSPFKFLMSMKINFRTIGKNEVLFGNTLVFYFLFLFNYM